MKLAFVYVTDQRGFELAKYSAISLAFSQPSPCDIHIFCYQFLAKPSPQFSAAMADRHVNLTFDTVSDPAIEQHKTCGHVTTPSLLKLSVVEKLLGRYDRVVYLDNDILVFDNLQIHEIDFGQAPVAAVIDVDMTDTGVHRRSTWLLARGKGGDVGRYFNSGFMIFESRNWRSGKFHHDYAAALDQHDIACPYKINCTSIDQCALNRVFENEWLELPFSYNTQQSAKFTKHWRTASVRHYSGARKFLPISLFRHDSRDVRYVNRIKESFGLPITRFPSLYEILFWLNIVRKYRDDLPVRRFLSAVQARNRLAITTRELADPVGLRLPGDM